MKKPLKPTRIAVFSSCEDLSRVMVNQEDGLASAFDVAEGVATTIVYGLTTFGKFIFDLIIVRAQMLSMEAIEPRGGSSRGALKIYSYRGCLT